MQNTKINDLIAVTEFENIIKKRDMYLFYENMFEYIGQSDMFSKHSHELEKYAKIKIGPDTTTCHNNGCSLIRKFSDS